MTNELLRRDEIWFVEKYKQGLSSLYSMAEYKDGTGESSRKDLNYMKNYLYGRYGGIPYINDGDNKWVKQSVMDIGEVEMHALIDVICD